MRQIDYDVEQYQHYARGRAFTERQLQAWIDGFADVLPRRRPLTGLDRQAGPPAHERRIGRESRSAS
jgi:hypothetical protein